MVVSTMCTVAAAQTSGRSRVESRSFRPIVNRSRVIPASEMAASARPPSTPNEWRANRKNDSLSRLETRSYLMNTADGSSR
jgi:hypothetical protein